MQQSEAILAVRRAALLRAIEAADLRSMYRRTEGQDASAAIDTRAHVLANWDAYADELRRWCEHTITGESCI